MTPRPAPRAAAGFVLVGVLMFIMVLTILGLTLFSLSGIESQFFTRSQQQQQALQSAVGALYRTQFVLARTGKLSDARNLSALEIPGVTYTTAWQDSTVGLDSVGSVAWNDTARKVTIRALAVINGERALIEARYLPKRNDDYYRRLLTLARTNIGGLMVSDLVGVPPNTYYAAQQVYLDGQAWVNRDDPALYANVKLPPTFKVPDGGVPHPDVAGYIGLMNAKGAEIKMPDAHNQYTLATPPGTIKVYSTPLSLGDDLYGWWSLQADPGYPGPYNHDGTYPVINVTGTCIWMFDRGFRAFYPLKVHGTTGSGNDVLILVSQRGHSQIPGDYDKGIALVGGLDADCPVIIVSEGGVGIEDNSSSGYDSSAPYLSIYSDWVRFWGPTAGHTMSYHHPADSPLDLPGGLIDQLGQNGYLPNMTGGTGSRFQPIAGTWHIITKSDGSY